MTELRPYQSAALASAAEAYRAGFRRVLLAMPTGAGKTVCFAHAATESNDATVVVAHRRELIRQASAKLGSVPHGIIAPGHPRTDHRIQVASIQTLARRQVRQFGLIILDESHHAVAGQWRRFLDSQPDARVLGVTATPERLDGRGLGDVFDRLIVGPSVADLVAAEYLSPCRVFAPPNGVDLSKVHTLAGDFNAGELSEVMDRPGLTGDAVGHYGRHAPGQPAIAFCASVRHAEHVAEAFRAEGWRSECVHGALPTDERDRRIAGLATGEVSVLTSCDLISEGLDVPAVGAVLMLRPTQSTALYLQMVGRGMRPAPGKRELVVLDHAGNVLRHGMPDAPREWTLAGTPRRERTAPAVRQCPGCFACHTPSATCPACGYEYPKAAEGRRMLTATDGELIELTAGAPALPPLREALKAARTFEEIDAIRRERGYKPNWTHLQMTYRRGYRGAGRSATATTAAEDFAA